MASLAPIADDALALIGRTPMVRVRHVDTGPCELFLKLESANPGGSIKDRIGLSMILAAERDGSLGGDRRHLVEATAGNTGLGLALVAAQRGYRLTLVIPDKMSREKVLHLKALGAEVVMTRSDVEKGHSEYYQDLAERIAREERAFYVNQFGNPANPAAHEATTGPEIVEQLEGRLDAMVCGVGSGGTITGLSRHFARAVPGCEMILADPVGSVLADHVETGRTGRAGSWLVEGIGEDFVPPIADLSRVRRAYRIPDRESLETARLLLRAEGILAGSSTGTLVAAALRHCREQDRAKRVCTLVCDSGNKYLSKMFDDLWMADQGLSRRAVVGDLTDLVTRRFADRAVVTVGGAGLHGEAEVAEGLVEVEAVVGGLGPGHARELAVPAPVEPARFDQHPAHRRAVPAQELGGRVHDQVRPPGERLAQPGRGERVVHHQRHAGLARHGRDRLQVHHHAARVGEALDEERLHLGGEGRAEGVGGGLDEAAAPAQLLERVPELGDRAAVQVAGGQELVARLEEREERQELGRMSRGGGHRGAPRLQAGEPLLQHRHRGVAEPRVDEAEGGQVEQVRGVVDAVEHVRGGLGHIIGVTKESAGAVAVALTPKTFDGHRLLVEIAVNTHTVGDLDKYDLKKIVSLEVDGKSVAPTSAPGLRGHHTRGQLVFPLEALPPSLAVEIRGLGEPALRVLRWP